MTETKVLVVYAGDTIGMAPPPDDPHGPLRPRAKADLVRWLPKSLSSLEEIGIDLEITLLRDEHGAVLEPIDSSNVTSTHRQAMARAVAERYDDVDGFVALHGTDTMA